MPSIRRQLILGILLSLLLILAVSGAALYETVRETLVRDLDASLLAKSRALATMVRRERGGQMELDFAEEFMPEFEKGKHPEYFEVRLEDGTYLEVSHSLGDQRLPKGEDVESPDREERESGEKRRHKRNEIAGARQEFWNLELPDGRPGRAISLRFIPQPEEELESDEEGMAAPPPEGRESVTVVVAQGRDEIQELLRSLLAALLGIGLLLPVVVAFMAALIVRRGLRPLDRLAREAGAIDSTTLNHRFPVKGIPAELAPIGLRLNDLLQRLQKAFQRERRFTADVAHELRTPVAELRSMTEVALLDSGDASSDRRVLSEVLDVALQMEKLIGALLAITRCEAGLQRPERRRVNLNEALRQAWKPFEARAAARRLSMEWELTDHADAAADPNLLPVILGNLFSNAVDHAPEGSRIRCRAEARDGRVCLSLTNPAPDLDKDDLPHLFEPFWRKDPSRSDSSHTGLGLALVAAAASLLGSPPSARLSDAQDLTVEIGLEPAPEGL